MGPSPLPDRLGTFKLQMGFSCSEELRKEFNGDVAAFGDVSFRKVVGHAFNQNVFVTCFSSLNT